MWVSDQLGSLTDCANACYERGKVFAVNREGLLHAFDANSGNILWNLQLPGRPVRTSPPVAYNGTIYTASDFTLYAIEETTGNILWTRTITNGEFRSLAITDEGIYATVSYSYDGLVYKFSPMDGQLIWHYNTSIGIFGESTTPVFYNGRLYVRNILGDQFLNFILDGNGGYNVGGFFSARTPSFLGNMGFLTNDPYLYGVELSANTIVWGFVGDGDNHPNSAPIVINNYVYTGSHNGQLYALDPTGAQIWSISVGNHIPFVEERSYGLLTGFGAGEGILVIPTTTSLVAFESQSSPDPITAPSNLWGRVKNGDVYLKWNDNSDNEGGFYIERALIDPAHPDDYQQIGEVGANVRRYVDEAVPEGTYRYRVQGFNPTTVSDYSRSTNKIMVRLRNLESRS